FVAGSLLSMVIVLIYTNMGITPFWLLVALNVVMFIGISSRMIAASALMTAVPEPAERGAFMGINASVQSISGGIASGIAGLIVVQETPTSPLQNYPTVGIVVVVCMLITIFLVYRIHVFVKSKPEASLKPLVNDEPVEKEVA
ncbi:MAG: MFS transporter, partial [Bacteroidia bacterium]|nr:MFS transporter [Bacteroidia bacterium]